MKGLSIRLLYSAQNVSRVGSFSEDASPKLKLFREVFGSCILLSVGGNAEILLFAQKDDFRKG